MRGPSRRLPPVLAVPWGLLRPDQWAQFSRGGRAGEISGGRPSLLLETAIHELADGFAGRAALGEHGMHLLGDGHLDARGPRQRQGRRRCADAFGHHAHAGEDLGERAALAEFDADGAIAAERAGGGEYEVAEAREPSADEP